MRLPPSSSSSPAPRLPPPDEAPAPPAPPSGRYMLPREEPGRSPPSGHGRTRDRVRGGTPMLSGCPLPSGKHPSTVASSWGEGSAHRGVPAEKSRLGGRRCRSGSTLTGTDCGRDAGLRPRPRSSRPSPASRPPAGGVPAPSLTGAVPSSREAPPGRSIVGPNAARNTGHARRGPGGGPRECTTTTRTRINTSTRPRAHPPRPGGEGCVGQSRLRRCLQAASNKTAMVGRCACAHVFRMLPV